MHISPAQHRTRSIAVTETLPHPKPLAEHRSAKPIADGVRIGHVHLKVADLERALSFYCDVLGFDLLQRFGKQAAFVSAGGYHHHIGLNSWESAGAAAPPPGTAALRRATIVLPDTAERDSVLARWLALGYPVRDDGPDPVIVDPSGNALALAVG
jgi:catechol 2,3-dioxygenase